MSNLQINIQKVNILIGVKYCSGLFKSKWKIYSVHDSN